MKKRRAIMAAVAALCAGVIAVGLTGCEWFSFGKSKPKGVSDSLGNAGKDTAAWLMSNAVSGDAAFLAPALRSSVAIVAVSSDKSSVSVGSGVIYSLDNKDKDTIVANVITNYHVTNDCEEFFAYLYGDIYDTTSYKSIKDTAWAASYVGGSEKEDIAVLSVTIPKDRGADFVLPITARESEAKAGESVYAVGNALGEGISVVSGAVSMEVDPNASFLSMRIDAPVNHGNSGGGLFDREGNFLGIVQGGQELSVKVQKPDGSEAWQTIAIDGFGYALPASRVISVAQSILDNNKQATRGRLGELSVEASRSTMVGGVVQIVEDIKITKWDDGSPFYGEEIPNGYLRRIVVTPKNDTQSDTENGTVNKEITRKHQIESILYNIRTGCEVTLYFDVESEEGTVEEKPISAFYNSSNHFEWVQ